MRDDVPSSLSMELLKVPCQLERNGGCITERTLTNRPKMKDTLSKLGIARLLNQLAAVYLSVADHTVASEHPQASESSSADNGLHGLAAFR